MILKKYNKQLSYLMKVTMLLLFFFTLYSRCYITAIGVIIPFFISFLPAIVYRNVNKTLPWTLDFLVTLSLFLHIIGVAFDLYHDLDNFWWWDELTHFLGTFAVGIVIFELVFTIQFLGRAVMSIPMTAFFIFMVSMGVGALWEIAEFFSDKYLGTYTQLSLEETIRDMKMNFIGAMVASFVGVRFLYVKRDELDEFYKLRRLKKELEEENRKKLKLIDKLKEIGHFDCSFKDYF